MKKKTAVQKAIEDQLYEVIKEGRAIDKERELLAAKRDAIQVIHDRLQTKMKQLEEERAR